MPDEAEKTIRETLEAAFEAEEEKTDGEYQQPEVQATVEPDATGDERTEGEQAQETVAEGDTGAVEQPEEQSGEPKFLPPEGAEQETGDQPVEPEERVPVAWRGEAKELWKDVPAPVRQEVLRRENQVNEVLRESADSRRFLEQFQRTVAPYQQYWVAEGSDPLTATRNLMQTAASLRAGTPQQKAQVVAGIIQQFGVDIEALDNAIVGSGPVPAGQGNGGMTPDVQAYLDQQLAPVNQFMNGLQQRAQQQGETQQRSVAAEIDAFEQDPKYVYYENVREEMADLLEMASKRGQEMSLEQAYNKAVAMDPKLSELTRKRQEAERAKRDRQTLEEKKRAASSLQVGTPTQVTPKEPKDVRGAIELAWQKHSAGGV